MYRNKTALINDEELKIKSFWFTVFGWNNIQDTVDNGQHAVDKTSN